MESVSPDGRCQDESLGGVAELPGVLKIDESKIRSHLDEVVRSTVEATLNQLLDQEADRVAGAGKYERSPDRQDTRAGSYPRKLQTKAGEVELKVPPGATDKPLWACQCLRSAFEVQLSSRS